MAEFAPFCADQRLDGPFTLGRQLVRALLDDGRPSRHPKEQLIRAFVDRTAPIEDKAATPLLLSIPRGLRLQYFSAQHLRFLCHSIAEVLEYHWSDRPEIEVCHSTEADETDRELIQALAERARFQNRPQPLRVVDCTHDRSATVLPDPGFALLDSVRLGFFGAAARLGRGVVEGAEWPVTYDPDFHAYLHAYAISLTSIGRPQEAVTLYRTAADRWKEPAVQATAYYFEAMFYARYGSRAELHLGRASELLRLTMAAAVSIDESATRHRRVAFYENSLALVDMKRGNLELALARVEMALAVLGRSPMEATQFQFALRSNRAVLLVRLGRAEEAIADLDFAVSCDPASAQPWADRAVALQTAGRPEEALADLSYAIEHCICGAEHYSNRAILRLQSGELDAALEDLRWARLLDSSDEEVFVQLAEALIEAEQFDEAAELLDEPTGSEATPQLSALRARLAVERGELIEALSVLNAAIDVHPDAIVLRTERAAVLHQLQRPADALADLDLVIADGGFDPVIEANRILLLRECRREAEAEAAVVSLLKQDLGDEVRDQIRFLVATAD